MIFQLSYTSTAISQITYQNLENIILTAIDENSKANITGCLVFFNHQFYQLLEGDKNSVLSLYDTIKKDNRHCNVKLISQEETKYRLFSNWNMAFHFVDEKRNGEDIFNEFKKK